MAVGLDVKEFERVYCALARDDTDASTLAHEFIARVVEREAGEPRIRGAPWQWADAANDAQVDVYNQLVGWATGRNSPFVRPNTWPEKYSYFQLAVKHRIRDAYRRLKRPETSGRELDLFPDPRDVEVVPIEEFKKELQRVGETDKSKPWLGELLARVGELMYQLKRRPTEAEVRQDLGVTEYKAKYALKLMKSERITARFC